MKRRKSEGEKRMEGKREGEKKLRKQKGRKK
jgi:hypothetical protein